MKISEVLEKARAAVEQGWVQGFAYSKGSVCSVGGVMVGTGELVQRNLSNMKSWIYVTNTERDRVAVSIAGRKAKAYLDRAVGEQPLPPGTRLDLQHGQDIVHFNDTFGRTKEEVLTAFDHAIKFAKEDEDAVA